VYHSPYKMSKELAPALNETKVWLKHYFAKDFKKLKLPVIDLRGTPFAMRAWKALLDIPLGKSQSYGQLAKKTGVPTAARAIGHVMGKNPITIIVPCHRVLGAQGTLTGYSSGLERKEWLLNHEEISYSP
jgi:methylated-DNA-[protein]-cysteine S-methyltransferase